MKAVTGKGQYTTDDGRGKPDTSFFDYAKQAVNIKGIVCIVCEPLFIIAINYDGQVGKEIL